MERRKIGVAAATVALCGALGAGMALTGCASQEGGGAKAPEAGTGAASATVKVSANGVPHIADWGEVYPDQTGSFLEGANKVEERDGDDRSHSHALLAEEMEAFVPDATYAVRCMGCHSSWFKEITEAHGTSAEILDSPMASYQDEFPDMEFWDCRTCHEDDPAVTLKPTNAPFLAVSKSYDFPVADAACGQCHSATSEDLWEHDWDAIDLYRNGVSAEGLFQTFVESEAADASGDQPGGGGYASLDEETGIKMYGEGSVVDLENFQGSNHQNLGLTCASCHMPTMTNENGEEYTSHDASGSPLENEAALEYCLSCHENQGIESPQAMVDFVLGKEDDVAERQLTLRADLEQLKASIVAAMEGGAVDEAALEEARMAWSQGRWYLRYTYGHEGENVGKKAAHNYDQMMDVLAQGHEIVTRGIDLLA